MFELRVVWKQVGLFVLIFFLVLGREVFVCLFAIILVVLQVVRDLCFQFQVFYSIVHYLFQRESINVMFVLLSYFLEAFFELINLLLFRSLITLLLILGLFLYESVLLSFKCVFFLFNQIFGIFDFLAVLNRFKQLAKELQVGGRWCISILLFKFFNKQL